MKKITGMKRGIRAGAVMLLLAVSLAACGRSGKLSEKFDEETVKAAAEALVDCINADDVEGFCSVPMSDEMKTTMTPEYTQSVFEQYIGNRGAFVEYESNTVVGATRQGTNEDCAAAVVVAEYENQKVTYTISYDADMNLIGFYLK